MSKCCETVLYFLFLQKINAYNLQVTNVQSFPVDSWTNFQDFVNQAPHLMTIPVSWCELSILCAVIHFIFGFILFMICVTERITVKSIKEKLLPAEKAKFSSPFVDSCNILSHHANWRWWRRRGRKKAIQFT